MLENTAEYKRFVWELDNVLDIKDKNKNIIFFCIGTNRIVGDAFGPVVGSVLKRTFSNTEKIKVVGDLKNTVTYNNVSYYTGVLNNLYKNNLMIVIDSALANRAEIGKVFIQNRGLKYAESLKKHNTTIGNISIKAVVGENVNNSIENFKNLNNVSIEKIKEMSDIVSNGIIDVMNRKANFGKNIYKWEWLVFLGRHLWILIIWET